MFSFVTYSFDLFIFKTIFNISFYFQDEQVFSLLLLMINLSNASRKHKCIKEHPLQESVCSLHSVYTRTYTTIESMIKRKHFYAVINYCVTSLSWCNKLKKMNNMCMSCCPHCEDFEKTMIDSLVRSLAFILYYFVLNPFNPLQSE